MKSKPLLKVTLLDVGWGDALFLESVDAEGKHHFGLIDSNDSKNIQTASNYLKRYFRRHKHYHDPGLDFPHFDFVLLSHDHADHRQGLERIVKKYGTREFWYPKSRASTDLAKLLRYARKQCDKADGTIRYQEALDVGKPLSKFGDAEMEVLWPPVDFDYAAHSVNDSSIVLRLKLGKWNVILSGDAEEEVWKNIGHTIPGNTRFFKVPHHGSINGTDPGRSDSWYHKCSRWARLGLSCDLRSSTQVFPSSRVIEQMEDDKRKFFRTDQHHHITFVTDGVDYQVIYSH